MSERPASFWRARSRREQALIGLMLLLAVLVLGFYGLFRPLERAAEAAQARLGLAAQRLAEVRAAETAPASIAAPDGDFTAFIAASAAQAGVLLAANSPAGPDETVVIIEAADPAGFFAWVQALNGQGAYVANMTAVAAGGGTARIEAVLRR